MSFDFLRKESTKTGLALDTTFSQPHRNVPQQIFPLDTSKAALVRAPEPPLNKRAKGLRPSPLDLTSAISPSDRAITIGLTVPTTSLAKHSKSSASSKRSKEPPTPSIIVTPAHHDFEPSAVKEVHRGSGYRPASSIYSRRATNYTTQRDTPPVPPLPTFINKYLPRASNVTIFEEQEENGQTPTESVERRMTSQSELPTPRRSRGWWNIITSPFSGTASGAFFWRSPSIPEEESDNQSILRNASALDIRGLENDVPQSAPLSCTSSFGTPHLPKRSETSPAAIRTGGNVLDIYAIPDHGEAAEYYRSDGTSLERTATQSTSLHTGSDISSPFHDTHQISDTRRQPTFGQAVFCSPSERELHGESPDMNAFHASARQSSYGMIESHFSPMTDTPTIEDAHVGRFMGPGSTTNLRQVEICTARSASPRPRLGLGEATMAHRWEPEPSSQYVGIVSRSADTYAGHSREGSYGLGISEPSSPKERELFPSRPAPALLSEKAHFHHRLAVPDKPHRYAQNSSRGPPWYRRFAWPILAGFGMLLILVIVLCVTLVPGKHQDIAIEAQWVNTTGFPPLPTGVMTVAKAQTVESQSGCVNPAALWSCASTSGQNAGSTTIDFRFVIRFQNGTLPANETQVSTNTTTTGSSSRIRSMVKRDFFTDFIYQANPLPPSDDDQLFVGRTTDNNTGTLSGEKTPFYISMIYAADLLEADQRRARKRDEPYTFPLPGSPGPNSTNTDGKNASTSTTDTIPKPALKPNGQPVSPTLYPFPEAQPIRLYNRGQDSEHYGFYTYFDKSIYIANLSSGALTEGMATNIPLADAKAVCTWSQTRFLIQIWTKKAAVTNLNNTSPLQSVPAINSTANVMTGHGSFPYSVTITVDRHGGDAARKGVYCYGLDDKRQVNDSAKMWISEDRAYRGSLVNPAVVPGGNFQTSRLVSRESFGGIDGGTGGCACAWQNW